MTCQPSLDKARAVAAPIPELAPVTTAVFVMAPLSLPDKGMRKPLSTVNCSSEEGIDSSVQLLEDKFNGTGALRQQTTSADEDLDARVCQLQSSLAGLLGAGRSQRGLGDLAALIQAVA